LGVGGVGKTRVALAAAERLESDRDLTAFVQRRERAGLVGRRTHGSLRDLD